MNTDTLVNLIEKGNEAFSDFKNDIESRFEVIEAKSSRPSFGGSANRSNEWKSAFDALKSNDFEGRVSLSMKTITSDGSGLIAPGILQPLVISANTMSVHLSDYIPQRLVEAPSVVVNTIGSTDLAGVQAGQGGAKHQLSASSTSQVIALETVADYMKVSVQSMQDIPDLQALVQGVLNMRLKAKIDAMLYATASTSGNFTSFTSASDKAIDNIVGGAAVLANYGLQGTVFLNPTDYANLMLTKATTAGMFLGLPQYEGLTVRQASVIPSNKFLITTTDGIGLGLAQRMAAMLIIGFENDDLTKNLRTALLEQRVASFVTDPNRVVIGNLVSAT